jgi:hypothetical protein
MKFQLAAHLGMTVGELDIRMGAAEFAEWVALHQVEPWGAYRQDLLAAIVSWAVAAPWSKEAKVSDFLPRFGEQEREQATVEQVRARLLALGGKHGEPVEGQRSGGVSGPGGLDGHEGPRG